MSRKGLTRYKALTFNVLGTLIDFETGILDYLQPLAKNAGVSIAKPAIMESFGWAETKLHKAHPDATFTELLKPVYKELAGVLGLPVDEASAEGLKQSMQHWPAFGDVAPALAVLKRHYRLVALTNVDNWGFWYMNKTLGAPFDDKVTAEDVGASKPDVQMFAYCLGRQSVSEISRKHVLHVAQSQYQDIGTASRLGWSTAWIERRRGQSVFGATVEPDQIVEPTFHFSSLREFADSVEDAFKD